MDRKSPPEKFTFDGPQVVAFHFVKNRHGDDLSKWVKLLDELAQEYAGRILFGLRDISNIGEFNSNLNPDDFGTTDLWQGLRGPSLRYAQAGQRQVSEGVL